MKLTNKAKKSELSDKPEVVVEDKVAPTISRGVEPKKGPGAVKRAQLSTLAIIRAVVIVMLTVFAMQNLSTVSVRFLFWSADVPVFSVALLVGIVGLVLGYFSGNRNTTRRLKAK